jgi:hypothetical protein
VRGGLIDAPALREFGCRRAERALALVKGPDPRSVAAIEAKRKWLQGEITDEELEEARKAARAAVKATADAAARAAAGDAAWNAARSGAHSAAWSAARSAAHSAARARAAAWDAAYGAEREWQVAALVEMLKGAPQNAQGGQEEPR